MTVTRKMALPYVSFVLTDSLNDLPIASLKYDARLVGWQCGFEPLFVAVQSYIDGVLIDDDEAVEIATDFLAERKWFSDEPTEPDYVI
jgi:hypothetical protein